MQQSAHEAEIQKLWAALYPDLKQLARARLRRSSHNTLLETTGRVNEAEPDRVRQPVLDRFGSESL